MTLTIQQVGSCNMSAIVTEQPKFRNGFSFSALNSLLFCLQLTPNCPIQMLLQMRELPPQLLLPWSLSIFIQGWVPHDKETCISLLINSSQL